jgi:hypothetical protein
MKIQNTAHKALESLARTADVTTPEMENGWWRGVLLVVDVTADPATASVVPKIEVYDPGSGKWITWFAAAAAITATGTYVYSIYPDSGAAADAVTEVRSYPLPKTWRIFMDHADTDSITYSVGYMMMG